MAAAGVTLLVLAAGYHLGIRPAMKRLATLDRVVRQKEGVLAQLRGMAQEYTALRGEIEASRKRIAAARPDFGILTFLENAGRQCGLTQQNVAHMKPATSAIDDRYQETRVDIQLERVSMQTVVHFLAKVRTAPALLSVRELRLKRARGADSSLDAGILVTSLSLIRQR